MAVTKQKPCINDTVLQLAKEAAVGEVFIYSGNEYQWTMRSEAWEGIMLTKTERGFELIDKNGRSHGIVNLGEPYHNIDPHPSCTACGKDYVFQNAVECITAVCCDQELYVGNCAQQGWSVDWCELITEVLNPPALETSFDIWKPAPQPNPEGTIAEAEWGIKATAAPQEKFVVSAIKIEVTANGVVLPVRQLPVDANGVVVINQYITDFIAGKPYTIKATTIDDKGAESEPTVLGGNFPIFNVHAPSKPEVSISTLNVARSEVIYPDTRLKLYYNWQGSNGGAPLVAHKLYLYKDGVLLSTNTIAPEAVPYEIDVENNGAGVYKLVGEASNEFNLKATAEDSIELEMPPLAAPMIDLEFDNFGGKRTNDVRAHINVGNTAPYVVDSVEYYFSDNTTAPKEGVIQAADDDGLWRFTIIDPYPNTGVVVRARSVSGGLKSEWTEVDGVVPPVVPDAPSLRVNTFEQVGQTITAHANFRWAASDVGQGGAPIDGYAISYREKGTPNEIIVNAGPYSTSIDFDMTGLKPNTTYTYWSTVSNEAGRSQTFINDFITPPLQLSFDAMELTGAAVTSAISNLPATQARNVINQQAAGALRIDRTEIIDNPFSSFAGQVPNAVLHKVTGTLNVEPQDLGTAVCLTYKANAQLLSAVQASVTESEAWCRVINTSDNNTINAQFAATAAQFGGSNIGAVFFVIGTTDGVVQQPRGFNNNNSGLTLSGHSVGNSNAVYLFDFSEVEVAVLQ